MEGSELMNEHDPADGRPTEAEWLARSDAHVQRDPGSKASSVESANAARSSRTRRFDPSRSDRIIDAVIEVIVDSGVAGTSFRRIATQADVPLGSMTYHFNGMQDLLLAGFERFVSQSLVRLEDRLNPARDPHDAVEIILALVSEDATADPPRYLSLSRELQALAIREPALRTISNKLIEGSTKILKRYFDPLTAEILEILMDGLTLRRGTVSTSSETLAADPAGILPWPWSCGPRQDQQGKTICRSAVQDVIEQHLQRK